MAKEQREKQESGELSKEAGRQLLLAARNEIAEQLGHEVEEPDFFDDDHFGEGRGTFVTLKINNRLRGCIGNLESSGTIVDGVRRNAINAAFNDQRFSPLTIDELDETEIEVSILSQPVVLDYDSGDELLSLLRPGVDGVIIQKGSLGATFLPQVWEELPEPEMFLGHLCRKAGIAETAWQDGDLNVLTYQVQYFKEE